MPVEQRTGACGAVDRPGLASDGSTREHSHPVIVRGAAPTAGAEYRRRVYRFLLTRRWLALALAVLVLSAVCVRLGVWQFSRLADRKASNAVVAANLDADPVDIGTLTGVDGDVSAGEEWRPVTASGRYDPAEQLLVRYQTRGDQRGVDVVVPLVADDGSAVLVDRGFLESPAGTPDTDDVPEAPEGEVTVTGWLRQDSEAGSEATAPSDGTVRAVAAAGVQGSSAHPLVSGWLAAREEAPAAATTLVGPDPPELDSGPHFFYGLQWFFFALLALVGYGYFAWDEAHPGRLRRREPERESHAVLNG